MIADTLAVNTFLLGFTLLYKQFLLLTQFQIIAAYQTQNYKISASKETSGLRLMPSCGLGLLGLCNGHKLCDSIRRLEPTQASAVHSGAAAVQGGRSSMEDFMIRAPKLCTVDDDLSEEPLPLQLYAVLDGHGGAEVARYSTSRLRTHLEGLSSLRGSVDRPSASSSGLKSPSAHSPRGMPLLTAPHTSKSNSKHPVENALIQSFEDIDRELSTHSTLAETSNWSGTTATAVVVGPKQFWIAHVGDSRAVLCRRGPSDARPIAVALTRDHKASCPLESERVTRAGGAVYRNQGLRLMGVLAVTRALGDRALQEHGLTPTPETRQVALTADDQFLIIASDGLWDVVTNQDAVQLAARVFQRVEQRENISCASACRVAATVLTRVALQRGSEDNISVVVVDLRHRARDIERARFALPAQRAAAAAAAAEAVASWASGSLETLFKSDGSLRSGGVSERPMTVSTGAAQAFTRLMGSRGTKLQAVSSSGCWQDERTSPAGVNGSDGEPGGQGRGRVGGMGDTDSAGVGRVAAKDLLSWGSAPVAVGAGCGGQVWGGGCGQKRRMSGWLVESGVTEHVQKAFAMVEVVGGVESPTREVRAGA